MSITLQTVKYSFENNEHLVLGSLSASIEEAHRQCELFLLEKERQQESIGRIEKIQVNYNGPPENTTMVMNKNISTPYDCAKRNCYLKRKRTIYFKQACF